MQKLAGAMEELERNGWGKVAVEETTAVDATTTKAETTTKKATIVTETESVFDSWFRQRPIDEDWQERTFSYDSNIKIEFPDYKSPLPYNGGDPYYIRVKITGAKYFVEGIKSGNFLPGTVDLKDGDKLQIPGIPGDYYLFFPQSGQRFHFQIKES